MKATLVVLVLVVVHLSVVFGATMFSPIQTNPDDRNFKYCDYNGVKFLPKTTFKLYEGCMRCTCDDNGLSCATLKQAFTVHVPDDSKCISVIVGCRNRWVYRDNPYKRCPKIDRPTDIAMVGK